eukprot:tig00000241_g21019.t1
MSSPVVLVRGTAEFANRVKDWVDQQPWASAASDDALRSLRVLTLDDWLRERAAAPAPSGPDRPFDIAAFFSSLRTSTLGNILLYGPHISSTQDIVTKTVTSLLGPPPALTHRRHFATFPFDGLVALADTQTAGRGRGSNTWTSPPGCLMFSFRSTETEPMRVPTVQHLVSLSIASAVASLPAGEAAKVRIKWPNDIYGEAPGAGLAKIGGVLCHSSFAAGKFHITTGVGLNVENAEPTTCLRAMWGAGPAPTREAVLAAFLADFERKAASFASAGLQPFVDQYTALWLHSGQEVTADGEGGPIKLVVRGLTAQGYLLAEAKDGGARYELHPDGNSLDFFSGLLRRKL